MPKERCNFRSVRCVLWWVDEQLLNLQLMNISTVIAAVVLLAGSTHAFGQTKIIAHRSHDGSMESFVVDGEDNFGLPPQTIDSVARISDTSAIEFTNFGVDTVYNHRLWNNPGISLDSLRTIYPGVNFKGFENGKKKNKADIPGRGADVASSDIVRDTTPSGGIPLLMLLGSMAVPMLAYGIWRTERRGKS